MPSLLRPIARLLSLHTIARILTRFEMKSRDASRKADIQVAAMPVGLDTAQKEMVPHPS
jgi:hypothetical protein